MESDDIKEGFICPMCMKDLGNASVLQKHFEEVHSEDKALRQIRGMFGKAKRKIMDKIESSEADGAIGDTVDGALEGPVSRGVDPFLWDHQEFGEENWELNLFQMHSLTKLILNRTSKLAKLQNTGPLIYISLNHESAYIASYFVL